MWGELDYKWTNGAMFSMRDARPSATSPVSALLLVDYEEQGATMLVRTRRTVGARGTAHCKVPCHQCNSRCTCGQTAQPDVGAGRSTQHTRLSTEAM